MSFDIIFLDIGMDGIDGMQTARELRSNGCRAVIIFVTAFEDRVFDAFDVGAFNFLVKPVSDDRFEKVLKKAIKSCMDTDIADKNERCITVKSGRVSTKLALSEIMYAEVLDRKITLHTVNGEVEYYGRLSKLENCTGDSFFRTHRAYLINLRYLEKIAPSLGLAYTTAPIPAPLITHPDIVAARSLHPDLILTLATDPRDRDIGDWILGNPELRLLRSSIPTLLLNQRDDLYVLCD